MTEESLFHQALELSSPQERAAFLDRACAGQPSVRAAVEALLQAHEGAGDFLQKLSVEHGATAEVVPGQWVDPSALPRVTEGPGTRIGPYKLLQQLGEGGMGTVFLADQEDPVKRRVALKVIKAGLDSAQVLARFEAERQALALMDHPNIAKVLDAGATRSGRPYFVMELVKGISITRFCDQERLTPRERLRLFIPVCQAVQHAHQKGVIHRDLKPSNVLIALYDGRPVAKIIDFGVAKAVSQKLTERTMFTEVGQVVGTLEYMSPEQAELNQLDVDTRSDVYSLGVLLYELLTGGPPFSREQLRGAGFMAMLRMIREVEPPKPSTKLSSSQELPSIAAKRKLEPKRLAKLVRGDLDWIVMKCLEKERGRRYETANGLAQDVERYLADEVVQAGPPGAGYRLRKFVKRNRGPVLAVTLLLLALLGGIAGTTAGLFWAIRAENEANRDRAAAVKSAQSADEEKKTAQLASERLRGTLYAADLILIGNAWDANNLPRVLELLDRQRPGTGERDLRGFEWYYWNRLSRPTGANASVLRTIKLAGQAHGRIGGANGRGWAFSRDGKRLALVEEPPLPGSGEVPAGVRMFDTSTGQLCIQLRVPLHDGKAGGEQYVAFSPDGSRMALQSPSGVKIWDTSTEKELFSLSSPPAWLHGVAFSPDGRWIASIASDPVRRLMPRNHELKLWNAATGKLVLTVAIGEGPIESKIAFSPDGTRIALGEERRGPDRKPNWLFKILDCATGETLVQLDGVFSKLSYSIAFSPDGTKLALREPLGNGADLTLWDTATGKKLHSWHAQGGSEDHLAFSPDGRHLAMDGRQGEVIIWQVEPFPPANGSDSPVLTLKGSTDSAAALVITPDGRRLLTAARNGIVREWDISELSRQVDRWDPSAHYHVVALSRDRARAVVVTDPGPGATKREILILETSSGRELVRLAIEGEPNGNKTLILQNSSGGDAARHVFEGKPFVAYRPVEMSLDGERLVLHWSDGNGKPAEALVLEIPSGRELARFPTAGNGSIGSGFTLSPDGKRFVWLESLNFKQFKVQACDLGSPLDKGQPTVRTLKQVTLDDGEPTVPFWFSPNGQRVLVFQNSKGLMLKGMVLDFATGNEVFSLPPAMAWEELLFRRDGRMLASEDGEDNKCVVRLWDADIGQKIKTFREEVSGYSELVLSPDGKRLLGQSYNAPLQHGPAPLTIWDVKTGQVLLTLKGNHGQFAHAAFSPDGSRIVGVTQYVGTDYQIKVWNARTGEELLTLRGPSGEIDLNTLEFSPDGHRLWAINKHPRHAKDLLKIWDATPLPAERDRQ